MDEPRYMTMAEIEQAYPNQWVLVDRLKKGRTPDVVYGGYVIYHGPDKDALEAKVAELPTPFDIAVRYTGPLVDEDEIVLLNLGLFQ